MRWRYTVRRLLCFDLLKIVCAGHSFSQQQQPKQNEIKNEKYYINFVQTRHTYTRWLIFISVLFFRSLFGLLIGFQHGDIVCAHRFQCRLKKIKLMSPKNLMIPESHDRDRYSLSHMNSLNISFLFIFQPTFSFALLIAKLNLWSRKMIGKTDRFLANISFFVES